MHVCMRDRDREFGVRISAPVKFSVSAVNAKFQADLLTFETFKTHACLRQQCFDDIQYGENCHTVTAI